MSVLPFASDEDDSVRAAREAAARVRREALQPASLEALMREHLRHYFAAHEGVLPPKGLHERVMALAERPLIQETLKATGGNQLKAAALLGINRNTLRKRIRDLGIALENDE